MSKSNLFPDTFVFVSVNEASDFLKAAREILNEYKFVTIADVFDLAGKSSDTCYIDNLYGWNNLDECKYVIHRDGYGVSFPPVISKSHANVKCNSNTDSTTLVKGDINMDSNKPDMVAHPPHYQSTNGLEVIDVIESFTSDLNGIEATDTGNILKYMCRWKKKNGLEDLRKAQWYINHLINHVAKNKKGE